MTTYKAVNSLVRGLEILRCLSLKNGRKPGDIAAATGIHRTTVYRLLETLSDEGYIIKSPHDGGYSISHKARVLGEGFDEHAWISEVGAPLLGELFREVVWPTDLTTFDGEAMVVRESTHRFSPLSTFPTMIGTRWPVLTTAIGRAYLAFCSAPERENILKILATAPPPFNTRAGDQRFIQSVVRQTQENGYGESLREADDRIASIAVPILRHERVLGCLNIIFFASAMRLEEAVRRYLPALMSTRSRMEAELEHWEDADLFAPRSTRISADRFQPLPTEPVER